MVLVEQVSCVGAFTAHRYKQHMLGESAKAEQLSVTYSTTLCSQ